jgi:hypothetical protein
MKHYIVRWDSTIVSEEYVIFIFRAEEWAKQQPAWSWADLLLRLVNDPEDWGDMFLWNVG